MTHHFSVDVEEYFHPTPLETRLPMEGWDGLPRRSPDAIARILDWLEERDVVGTFFVLGWLAEREPQMVRAIARAGHEIASHGWSHRLVTGQTPSEFREDVRKTKRALENLVGAPVSGYRAPSFSIVPGFEWALDVLIEEGHRYDSSLFPVGVHPTYGYPCDRDPHVQRVEAGPIVEIPPSTLRAFGTTLPAAGGAYLRFFPYALLRAAFKSAAQRSVPGTFYIHPWEIDDGLPALDVPFLLKTRLRGSLGNVSARVRRLIRDFDFRRMDETASLLHPAWAATEGVPPAKGDRGTRVN